MTYNNGPFLIFVAKFRVNAHEVLNLGKLSPVLVLKEAMEEMITFENASAYCKQKVL